MVEEERIRRLNGVAQVKGAYILYWMQASQRAGYNHALEYAISRSNEMKLPLLVFFGLTAGFPEANERHYRFMLEGLSEVRQSLAERGIGMIIRQISPEQGATELAKQAVMVVCDRGYLRIQRQWRNFVAEHAVCPVVQVESDVIVPVETASGKEEYSAATLRRKLVPMLPRFTGPFTEETLAVRSLDHGMESLDISDINTVIAELDIDHSVKAAPGFTGGSLAAKERLHRFVEEKLDRYTEGRNDPNDDCTSGLSPYLHFGQISPLSIVHALEDRHDADTDAFLEELIVRRELACNYVFYNNRYDSCIGLPEWSKKTLEGHRSDKREYVYTREAWEKAETHDPYWNAAQREMVETGKMHGYMRMYWGKKLIEWSATPEEAFAIALYLNNKYELDGRDPNGFAGVAWCFGKHDRPWAGRPVFGNVRYMNANGLKRKFDADRYAAKYGV